MKRIHCITTAMLLFIALVTINAKASANNYFIGKWKVAITGTPNGDSVMNIEFKLDENGKLVGQSMDENNANPTKFTRVEATEKSITAYWVAQGYDVYLYLEKVDENKVEGSLMDMFDAKGTRVVENK